jgi:hypothetical protein
VDAADLGHRLTVLNFEGLEVVLEGSQAVGKIVLVGVAA